MNTGNPTAIPHDDTKALSAHDRAKANERFRNTRDHLRRWLDEHDGKVERDA